MQNIFPLARSKRVKSKEHVLSLYVNNNLMCQEKVKGISCHIVYDSKNLSIINRVGFDITKHIKKRKCYQELFCQAKKIGEFHLAAVIVKDLIVIYDCLSIGKKKHFDTPAKNRHDLLSGLDIFSDNVKCIKSYDSLSKLLQEKEGVDEVIFKPWNSKYPIRRKRSKEPIAEWYTLSLKARISKDVIVDSYNTGSSKNDIVFTCKQYRKGSLVKVGKMRLENERVKISIIRKIKMGKRVVCEVVPDEKNSEKLNFLNTVKDKPFSSVEIDIEREIVFVEVINVSTKKVQSFKA